ncbi:ABC transporter permease [Streptomyces sp. NPDC001840]
MADITAGVTTASPTAAKKSGPPILVLLAGAFVLLVLALMIFGSFVTPFDPAKQDLLVNVAAPGNGHWFGTDQLGRDVLSRVIAGTRIGVVGPLVAALGTVVLGATLGVLAGYLGGFLDTVVNRMADLMYALPALLVIIVIVGVVGGGYWFAVAVLAVLGIPSEIRLCRSATMVQARLPYIEAARTMGLSPLRIMTRHIVPNILPTLIATFLLDFVGALISLSGLAYLGLGVPPGTPDWGSMLQDGRNLLDVNPWLALAPGIMIALTATSVTLIGDWLYDRFSTAGDRA